MHYICHSESDRMKTNRLYYQYHLFVRLALVVIHLTLLLQAQIQTILSPSPGAASFSFAAQQQSGEKQQQLQQYFRIKPVDTEAVEGDVAELQCQVGSQAGAVQWSKDGFLLGFSASIPGYPRYAMIMESDKGLYNLRIHNTQLDDEAEYQCQVGPSPAQQPIRASSRLNVIVPPKSLAMSGSKAEATSKPNLYRAEVKEGEKIVLICFASQSKPPPRIKWFRKNTELLPEASRTYYNKTVINNKYLLFTTESSIILYPKIDEQYTCEVQHPGLIKPLRASALINILNVPGPPFIEGFKEGDIVLVAESLTLTCTSKNGYPPPKVIWYRNGLEVDRSFIVTSRNDVINSYTFAVSVDDNQAVYRCSVTNSLTPKPLEAAIRLNVLFLPAKVSVSGPSEARLYQTIAIVCTTRPANPPPRISWYVDGNASSSGVIETKSDGGSAWIVTSTLTLTISRQDPNSKTFMCSAESSALRETVYATHRVTVIYPPNMPTLLGFKEGQIVEAGTMHKFKCVVLGGNPAAQLRWFKDEREISAIASVTGSGVSSELVIRPEPSDNGANFKCQANSPALNKPMVVEFKLTVYYPPEKATIRVEPAFIKANESVRVECATGSSHPASVIEWRKNGKNVIDHNKEIEANKGDDGRVKGKITRSWFSFNVTSTDDGSVITCLARNPLIEGSLARDDYSMTVHFKPEFESVETHLVLAEGENKVVNISYKANPKVERFLWKRIGQKGGGGGGGIGGAAPGEEKRSMVAKESGRELAPLPFNSMRTNGSLLYIWNISRNETGKYVFIATNKMGESRAYLNIDVLYSASIEEPINVIASSGKRGLTPKEGDAYIELLCRIDSNPASKVSWRKRDKEQNIDWFRAKLREENFPSHQLSILTIFNISRSDAGLYTCSASNGIGPMGATKKMRLDVQFKPTVLREQVKVAADLKADSVKLVCAVRGFPDLRFNWTVNERNTAKYRVVRIDAEASGASNLFHSELVISDITEEDFRAYRCHAYNSLGSDFTDFELVRKSIPESPTKLKLINVTHDSVQLEWEQGFDGGLEQSFRIRYRRLTDQELEESNFEYNYVYASPGSSRITLNGLEPETEYQFTVSARNKLGESLMSLQFLKARTHSSPDGSRAKGSGSVFASADEHRLGRNGIISETASVIIGCITVALLVIASGCAFFLFFSRRRKQRTKRRATCTKDATTDPLQTPFLISPQKTAVPGMCDCEPILGSSSPLHHQQLQGYHQLHDQTQPHILPLRQHPQQASAPPKCLCFEDYNECPNKRMARMGTTQQPDILMNQIKEHEFINHSICCGNEFKRVDETLVISHSQPGEDVGSLCEEAELQAQAQAAAQRSSRVSIISPEFPSSSPLTTVHEEVEETV